MSETTSPSIYQRLSSRTLPWPADWTALFGAARPLIVEIGFGKGAFLLHLARTHPEANVIGLEISNQSLESAERAIERDRLTNLRVIQSTAETALHQLFQPATIRELHINFPDPWFKTRHSHRRLMQRDTLDAMVSRLETGGVLYLATDIVEYAEMSADLLESTPGLTNTLSARWTYEMPGRVVTKYEATARREGRPCHYFAYRRNDIPAPLVPVVKELPMPHVILTTPLSIPDIRERFEPSKQVVGDITLSVMGVYEGRHSLLFEAFVRDPTIDQHCALMLNQHKDGTYVLLLSGLGNARPTPGIHRAVRLLAGWVAGLHPDGQITEDKTQGV